MNQKTKDGFTKSQWNAVLFLPLFGIFMAAILLIGGITSALMYETSIRGIGMTKYVTADGDQTVVHSQIEIYYPSEELMEQTESGIIAWTIFGKLGLLIYFLAFIYDMVSPIYSRRKKSEHFLCE